MGEFLKRRSSVTNINIKPDLASNTQKTPSNAVDLEAELYDLKEKLSEKDKELAAQKDMLKDYISNRINISRDLPSEDQITRLKKELKKLGYIEPQPQRPVTPPISMQDYQQLQTESRSLRTALEKSEASHRAKVQKLVLGHAEEIATLNLDIFELRDQLNTQDAPKADSRLVIELSSQVSQLIGEVETLQQKLSKYES